MNKFTLLLLALAMTVSGSFLGLQAQMMTPPSPGEYETSKTEKQNIQGVTVPRRIEAKLTESDDDMLKIGFRRPNSTYFNYVTYHRLNDNTFALKDNDGYFSEPVKSYLVLRDENTMELYEINGSMIDDWTLIAPAEVKFNQMKKVTKKNVSSYDVKAANDAVTAANEGMKAEIEAAAAKKKAEEAAAAAKREEERQAAAAKRDADRKAAEEAARAARANADLCTPMKKYLGMANQNFASLQGKLDADETELEGENVYFTNEVLPLFSFGRIMPTWKEGVKKLQFLTSSFSTKEAADLEMAFIQSRLESCYKNQGGFRYSVDSGIHFYKGSGVQFEVMRKSDWDDDGNTIYRVLLQMQKK